ncbi:hypothetical protein PGH07_07885 [Sulfurovum sp. zt1-1]|uniref:Uncharacterized protein n=1 Tax=Sulfurovum zhangzhouensis TaxID=3019067 RepID=A0ABT7QZ33_9BACT|nr:hypothetical protein [Sulfurovum zhangzhouensis]MDM5272097.1 hypothetical protein [Sulfurovum zhangzhouensis]
MNKPILLYAALTKAVDDFNTRHNITRGHLADAIGFSGDNAAIQFSNCLNPNNYDKSLNAQKIDLLIHTIDHEARMVFFREYMRQFGIKPVSYELFNVTVNDLRHAADKAAIEGSESIIANMKALSDGEVTVEEAEIMLKEATDVEKAQGTYIHMLNEYISKNEE